MSIGQRRYTQIPPESTGDRIQVHRQIVVNYTKLAPQYFFVGDTITTSINAFTGKIINIIPTNTTSGQFYLLPDYDDATVEDLDIVNGETITSQAGQAATANGNSFDLYINNTQIVGGNNPNNIQFVDNQGQALVAFGEGSQQFDAFGKGRITNDTIISEYNFNYDILTNFFTAETVTGGSVSHDSTAGALLLTNTTATNAAVNYTSNLYHKYFPGQGQIIHMTIACGDEGKAELTRTWGAFDDNDGFFFRQTENDFEVVIRNNSSGSPVETAVSQVNFNGDVVDGSLSSDNLSGFALDTSKDNLYWIDYQWLGAGRVRFGIYGSSTSDHTRRIVLHEFQALGANSGSITRQSNLPVRFEQINSSSGTGSTSEMRCFCSVVATEGFISLQSNQVRVPLAEQTITNTESYLFAIRPKTTLNGIENRIVGVLHELNHSIVDTADGITDDRLIIRFYLEITGALTSPSWTSLGTSSGFEYDIVASPVTLTPSVTVISLGENYVKGTGMLTYAKNIVETYRSRSKLLLSSDGSQPVIIFTAQNPVSGNSADAYLSLTLEEV